MKTLPSEQGAKENAPPTHKDVTVQRKMQTARARSRVVTPRREAHSQARQNLGEQPFLWAPGPQKPPQLWSGAHQWATRQCELSRQEGERSNCIYLTVILYMTKTLSSSGILPHWEIPEHHVNIHSLQKHVDGNAHSHFFMMRKSGCEVVEWFARCLQRGTWKLLEKIRLLNYQR